MEYAYLVVGVILGLIAGLKVIAPRTRNKVDDKVLDALQKVEPILPKK